MRRLVKTILAILVSISVQSQNLVEEYSDKSYSKARYSPDKTLLAVADGKDLKLYSAGTSTLVHEYDFLSKDISAICFNIDGSKVIGGGYGKEIVILDVSDGAIDYTIPIEGRFMKSAHMKVERIEMINSQLAAIIYSNSLFIVNIEDGKIEGQKRFENRLKSLAINPANQEIFVGGGEKVIYKLNTGTLDEASNVFQSADWVTSIAISQDSKWLAYGNEKGVTSLVNLESGEELKSFTNVKGAVTDLEFSADGKYLAMLGESGPCHLYNLETGRFSFSLEKFGRTNVLGVSFNKNGAELATVEELQNVKTWDITPLNISEVYDFKDASDKTGPSIYVSNPPNITNDRVTFSGDIIRIQGTAIDETGVNRIRVNGMNTPIKENGGFTINLPLTMGENYVNIEVTDVNDNISVRRFVVNRKNLDGETFDPETAKNYLFIVGINDYTSWPKLYNAVSDAEKVANVLIGKYGFNFSDVTMLLNEKATMNNIYQELRSLIEKVTPKDNLLVYYSGHGYFDELLNEGYWVPKEANVGATGEYLSNSNLLKILGNINSQHTFLVVDACFSGSLFAQQTRGYTDNVERYKSRWGLASGRLETVSDGAYGENSPFATKFLEFLKTTDKMEFPVSELVQFVKIEVANQTEQTPIGNPIKSLGDEGGEMIFRKKN